MINWLMINVKRLVVVLAFAPCVAWAQVKPRIAGLGGNAEYMQLLEQERGLSRRADSLGGVVAQLREEFRTNPGDRLAFAERIVKLENEVFEIRSRAGGVAARIGKIEEAFILENLQGDDSEDVEVDNTGEQRADLVRNDVFSRLLPGEDYAALLRAQAGERRAADLLRQYLEGYDRIAALGTEYAAADNAVIADSLYAHYLTLDRQNTDTADSLGRAWRRIFDDKLFAYNYLLQTQNQPRLLTRLETSGREARDEIARQRANAASEDVVTYFGQKGLVFEYETTLAGMFGLTAAADSLRRAADVFEQTERPIPAVTIEERLFIEYADIEIHNPAKYNAANPIPEVEVYRRGLIYRIMLNSYKVRQVVSIFKGIAPLAYSQDDGQWAYYAGGYADFGQAANALADMKQRGFRNARIVVWNDGQALVLDEKPTEGVSWRLQIDTAQLPEEVRTAISTADGSADISRSGDTFIVGPFPTLFEAEKIADAVRKAAPAIPVRTVLNNI